MTFIIKKLTKELLKEKAESFIESLLSLKWDPDTDINKLLRVFEKNKGFETVLVAINQDNWDIAGSARILEDRKYIRWWDVKAWRIEEVIVSERFQWHWVGTLLLESAIAHAKESGCYKVGLACSEENKWFYERFDMEFSELEMKLYL